MNRASNIISLSFGVTSFLAIVSCQEKPHSSNRAQTPREPDHSESIEIPVLPKYENPLKIGLSATASEDQKALVVTFSGEGECDLMIAAAFSDKGKTIVGFSLEESILETDLATMDGMIEWCILKPKNGWNYEATISYPIPDEYAGKFSGVAVQCLIYPVDISSRGLFDPIWVRSGSMPHHTKAEQGAPDRPPPAP